MIPNKIIETAVIVACMAAASTVIFLVVDY